MTGLADSAVGLPKWSNITSGASGRVRGEPIGYLVMVKPDEAERQAAKPSARASITNGSDTVAQP
jgi:hypothetical protein